MLLTYSKVGAAKSKSSFRALFSHSEEAKGVPPASKGARPAGRPPAPWTPHQGEAAEGRPAGRSRGHLQRIISIEEDHLPQLLQAGPPLQGWGRVEEEKEEEEELEEGMDLVMSDIRSPAPPVAGDEDAPTSPRGQPVGKETSFKVSPVTLWAPPTLEQTVAGVNHWFCVWIMVWGGIGRVGNSSTKVA